MSDTLDRPQVPFETAIRWKSGRTRTLLGRQKINSYEDLLNVDVERFRLTMGFGPKICKEADDILVLGGYRARFSPPKPPIDWEKEIACAPTSTMMNELRRRGVLT
jgi:hypothetical protein